MAQTLKNRIALKINEYLRPSGVQIVSVNSLRWRDRELDRLGFLAILVASGGDRLDLPVALEIVDNSQSQLGQDLFALASNDFKRGGFFVEFGATDGLTLSNTYLLEKSFGWTGILAEPGKRWHSELGANRSGTISNAAVWESTGEQLSFSETNHGELSTLTMFKTSDLHAPSRQESVDYEVPTISLLDLLDGAGAPTKIDFLSMDTEGSEWEILQAFDFSRYNFGAICVEHNYGSQREKIRALLTLHGYRIVFAHYSKWDDWYLPAGT
jgi:FkbM family methyltransferase